MKSAHIITAFTLLALGVIILTFGGLSTDSDADGISAGTVVTYNDTNGNDWDVTYWDTYQSLTISKGSAGTGILYLTSSDTFFPTNLTNLTQITIDNSITDLGTNNGSFGLYYLNSTYKATVTTITLSTSLTSLPDLCFKGFTALQYSLARNLSQTTFDIPSNITTIGRNAFKGCSSLSNVTLHEGLTTLGNMVFIDTAIQNIDFPSTVTSIGTNLLRDGTNIINVYLYSPTVVTFTDATNNNDQYYGGSFEPSYTHIHVDNTLLSAYETAYPNYASNDNFYGGNLINYTVTFDANGGSPTPTAQTVHTGGLATMPTSPTKTGQTFNGWYNGSTFWDFTTDTVTSNITLTAHWITYYTVTYHWLNSTSTETVASGNYATGHLINNESYGYSSYSWSLTEGGSAFGLNTPITSDTDLYLVWGSPIEYTLSAVLSVATYPSVFGTKFTVESATINLPNPTVPNGYTFDGYYHCRVSDLAIEGNAITSIPSGTIGEKNSAGEYVYYVFAKCPAISYTITYNVNGGTAIEQGSYTIVSEDLTLPTPTRNGYIFGGWFVNSDLSGTAVTKIVQGSTGNKVFYAKWTPEDYSIKFYLNYPSGHVPDSYTQFPVKYYNIETATFSLGTPTVPDGYTFGGWFKSSSFNGTALTQIEQGTTGTMNLYAKWTANTSGGDGEQSSETDGDNKTSETNKDSANTIIVVISALIGGLSALVFIRMRNPIFLLITGIAVIVIVITIITQGGI